MAAKVYELERIRKYATKNYYFPEHFRKGILVIWIKLTAGLSQKTVKFSLANLEQNMVLYIIQEELHDDLRTYFEACEKFLNSTDGDLSWLSDKKYWKMFEAMPLLFRKFCLEIYNNFPNRTVGDNKEATEDFHKMLSWFGLCRKE